MWRADPANVLKVRLHERGESPETLWAEDLGPAPGLTGGRRVRLGNVPILHAKPTYGDAITVAPDTDGVLAWDSLGVEYDQIGSRIDHDAGRWVLIIDYAPAPPEVGLKSAFDALDIAGEHADIAVEGAFVHGDRMRARAYLAAPAAMSLANVLDWIRSAQLPLTFTLVHPIDE